MATLTSLNSQLSSSQLQLYEFVISYHYNPTVAAVTRHLLLYSPSTLQNISRHVEIDLEDIKKSLIILSHHDIVRVTTDNSVADSQTLYSIVFQNILYRLLIPWTLPAVAQTYSKIHSHLILQFVKYGLLTYKQCISLTRFYIIESNPTDLDLEVSQAFQDEEYAGSILHSALNDLLLGKIVVSTSTDPDKMDVDLNVNFSDLFYAVDLEALSNLLYNQEAITNFTIRFGNVPVAKDILYTLLFNEIPMTATQIHTHLISFNSEGLTLEYISRLLTGLVRHPDGVVHLASKDDYSPEPKYGINLKQIKKLLLHHIIFSCIEQSCGIQGARIWNLIATKDDQFWNPQGVSQRALMSLSTVRSILYNLSLRGYVRIHELPLSKSNVGAKISASTPVLNSGIKQSHPLHFTSSFHSSALKVLQDCYKIASNILQKRLNLSKSSKQELHTSETEPYTSIHLNTPDMLDISFLHTLKLLLLINNSI